VFIDRQLITDIQGARRGIEVWHNRPLIGFQKRCFELALSTSWINDRGIRTAEKKGRRVALGPNATCVFENRDTALMQIQEMLRTERITRPAAIDHEIETYDPYESEVLVWTR